jgi:Carbonic anhydrase
MASRLQTPPTQIALCLVRRGFRRTMDAIRSCVKSRMSGSKECDAQVSHAMHPATWPPPSCGLNLISRPFRVASQLDHSRIELPEFAFGAPKIGRYKNLQPHTTNLVFSTRLRYYFSANMSARYPLTCFSRSPVSPDEIPSIDPKKPQVLWIGCSSGGILEMRALNLPPEEILVHRNPGNLLPNNDLSSMSTLEYALKVSQVSLVSPRIPWAL